MNAGGAYSLCARGKIADGEIVARAKAPGAASTRWRKPVACQPRAMPLRRPTPKATPRTHTTRDEAAQREKTDCHAADGERSDGRGARKQRDRRRVLAEGTAFTGGAARKSVAERIARARPRIWYGSDIHTRGRETRCILRKNEAK